MTIKQIENMTYNEAVQIADDTVKIKGHDCIFTDLGDAFGYSVLVFYNGQHIYHANDYALHHDSMKTQGNEALHTYYVNNLNEKLYTEEDMLEDIKTYDEYRKKDHFLRNYYIMRYEHISIFNTEPDTMVKKHQNSNCPVYCPVCMCYVSDIKIVQKTKKLSFHIKQCLKKLQKNNTEFRNMVKYELANHEACITCSYTEAIYALGIKFKDLTKEKQEIVKDELMRQINNYG